MAASDFFHAVPSLFGVDVHTFVIVSLMLVFFFVCFVGQMYLLDQVDPSEYHLRTPATKPPNTVWRELKGEAVASPIEASSIVEKRRQGSRQISWEEVRKHNKPDDVWIVVEGKVFDVSRFVSKHPGGFRPILAMAGRDSTEVMLEFHPANIFDKYLPTFYIGDVVDDNISEIIKDFRAIRQELLSRGLFRTHMSYYYFKFVWLVSIFVPTIYGVVACTSSTAHMLSALGMALFWQQLAFIGHDLGHSSVSHQRSIDYFYGGLFGNLLGGIGLSWWKNSHETHHVTCNSIEMDPDIQHLPFLALSKKMISKSFFSTYHLKTFEFDSVARFFVRYQRFLFYPIMCVARFNLYAQSWILLLFRDDPLPNRFTECASLAFFWIWLTYFICILPSCHERLAYLLLSHGVAGVLHVQITLSHFISEIFSGASKDTWIAHQMKTTTDITCPKYMDWFHGGLQFQLEHHLFPRLPRHNLRIARALVIELSLKHGLPYAEMGFFEANGVLLDKLQQTANAADKMTTNRTSFFESPIWEGLNAIG